MIMDKTLQVTVLEVPDSVLVFCMSCHAIKITKKI